MAEKVPKHQFWEIMCYPESCPQDFKFRLEERSIRCAISPCHNNDRWDHDIYDSDAKIIHKKGDLKKPHYHILIHFSGGQTRNAVLQIAKECCNSEVVQWKQYPKNAYEYLDHHKVVNEYKPLYDAYEIQHLCGFDPEEIRTLSKDEINQLYKDIHKDILEMDLLEYSDLLDYYYLNDEMEKYEVCRTHTILFKGYLDSRRHKRKGN